MSSEYELEGLVNEVQSLLATISGASSGSSSKNIRRILTFLAKVIQVVDQAFRDVYTILIEFKYLGMEDIESGRIYKLQKELDILRARDHYRDAEQICSRLHFLNEQFHSDIEPIIFLTKNRKVQNWSGILRLIEEREGSIIMLVNSTIYELQRMFNEKLDRDGLEAIKITAGRKAESIRSSLIQLEALQNKILGLSGEVGFLELTREDSAILEKEVNIFLDKSNRYTAKEMVMGNQYSFGNITGSNINIDSTLEQVTQNIGSTKNIDETVKKQLAELIDQLKLELQKAPPMNKEDAEAIAESAKALIEASTKSQPNKTTVRITAEGLKKAAENIAGVMPTVLTIASGIVKTVVQIVGIPVP